MAAQIPKGLADRLLQLFPGGRIVESLEIGADTSTTRATVKAAGYGRPLRITVQAQNARHVFVFHTAKSDGFGHDRRADRAEEMLLAYDTFGQIPRHVAAIDVGAIADDGNLVPLQNTGELYLLSEYAPGRPYATDLRRVAKAGRAQQQDIDQAVALARYLVALHVPVGDRAVAYRRAIRDVVGNGEGVFGITDSYPQDTPAASCERLRAIEKLCVDWRWRLKDRHDRLRRSHGDFHPFNILFDDAGRLRLLDTSRGSLGDPADDVTCLAINYIFFAIEKPSSWKRGLGRLWYAFWEEYLGGTGDWDVLENVAPYLAWRGLVLCSPVWYPNLTPEHRDKILGLAERALNAPRFEPKWAEDLFE